MSAATAVAPARRPLPAILGGPAEGWLTLAVVALMALALGWALDEPGWVTDPDLTDFLAPAALLGVAAGFLAAKARLGRWTAHLAGAVAAALILPVIVGEVLTEGGTPIDWFTATAASSVGAWVDLAIRELRLTRQLGHHLLAFGIVAWGAGQYAAYTVFAHRRPIDAVTVLGLLIVASMAPTDREMLHFLTLFSIAALVLLVRSHAFDEQAAWVRRRIGDPAVVRTMYLRGGGIFVAIAVMGSLSLTLTASSAPLQGLWSDFPQRIADISQALQPYLPSGGATRPLPGLWIGSSTTITGSWTTNDAVALQIRVPTSEGDRPFYWRAATYDRFDQRTWSWGPVTAADRAAGDIVLTGSLDDATVADARREVAFEVLEIDQGYRGTFIFSPQAVASVNHDTTLTSIEPGGFFAGLERNGTAGYTVTALVPTFDDVPGGLTKNRLRVAGADYPVEVRVRYRDVAPGVIGPEAERLLNEIKAEAPGDTPYDLAETMVRVLRDPSRFTYDTNVTDVPCGERSTVECFAWSKRGYCQYYATTMAILLRSQGIPTRIAQGYLPGQRDPATGIETIRNAQSHAWVEVYFPGYGWVDFDPTGGGVARDEPLVEGQVVPTAAPTPTPTGPFGTSRLDDETDPPLGPGGAVPLPPGSDQPGPYIAIALLLAVAFSVLAFVLWQRGPRGELGADAAWRGVSRLAGRLGFGARPSQTVFEYAGSLADVIPSSRPELQTVARAKVEVAYGGRTLDSDRTKALRDAHRRLRVGLLRLLFRRKERWSRRGRGLRRR